MAEHFGKTLSTFTLDGREYHANACIDGVLINPLLPEYFDATPNEERSDDEIALWWDRPFIQVENWLSLSVNLRGHHQRLRRAGIEYAIPLEEMDAFVETQRAIWFEAWPEGERFDVRCLDGGAWDRSTNWGQFATLKEALKCIAVRQVVSL